MFSDEVPDPDAAVFLQKKQLNSSHICTLIVVKWSIRYGTVT
jgi:hypothetical protein